MDEEVKQAMEQRFREYLLGWAYIPIQDVPRYEKAYREVNGIK